MKSFLLPMVLLAAATAQAQNGGGTASGSAPVVMPPPSFPGLKAYLNLTDAQVSSLTTILENRNAAQQAIYRQIGDKQTELYSLLSAGTTDALRVGQLMLDINNLQKQAAAPIPSSRTAALAVLTADQKGKLTNLSAALQLQQPAWEAVTLDLIDAPKPILGPPIIMPAAGMGEGVTAAAIPAPRK